MGNLIDASNSINPAIKTRKYLYDKLYRLSRVDDGNNVLAEDYAYTKTGDRTLKQLGAQAPQVYSYLVGTHRLNSVGGTSRSYDSNGNLLSITIGRTNPTFTFNERNRMSASLFNGTVSANYSLSGRGERVAKLDPLGKNSRLYAYDEAGHLLGDYPATAKPATGIENLYLDDMPVATTIAGALSYLETDHLGTPRIAANPATNAQQWKWDFFGDAFGGNAATIAPTGGIDVKLRYPGQQFDAETGLHYNYFRDYEAGTGRYVESDPIGLYAGPSTFGYVEGTPFRYADLYGLQPQMVLFRPGSPQFNNAQNYASNPAECAITGHGDPRGMRDANGGALSAADIAEMYRKNPDCVGKPIRLLACHTGVRPSALRSSFAGDVARECECSVYAPDNWGWWYPNGDYQVHPTMSGLGWNAGPAAAQTDGANINVHGRFVHFKKP